MPGRTRWMRSVVSGVGVAALALMALGVGAGGTALTGSSTSQLYPLVSQSFTTNSARSDWVLPNDPSGFASSPLANSACLTAGGTPTAPSSIPQCNGASDPSGSGSLRLTPSVDNQLGTVFYAHSVPTDRGLVVRFDTYQYNGNPGADGLGFVLAAANPQDPSPPSIGGNPGGSLGYGPFPAFGDNGSPSTPLPGIPDAYLGVGLDVFGNYLNPYYNLGTSTLWQETEQYPKQNTYLTSRCGFYEANGMSGLGAGQGPQNGEQVTVKGPGNGFTGYCPISSTAVSNSSSFSLDQPGFSSRPSTPVEVEVVLNTTGSSVTVPGLDSTSLTVAASDYAVEVLPYEFSATETPISLTGSLPTLDASNKYDGVPSAWIDRTTGLPYQLSFGFTASTGGLDETHEITNVTAETIAAPAPVLGLGVTDSTNHVMAVGIPTTFTFTPSVGASGGTETEPIVVSGSFPSGVTPDLSAASGSGWSCVPGSATGGFTCTYATPSSGIGAGSTVPHVSIPATAASVSSTPLVVSATVSSNDALPSSASDSVTVVAAPVSKVSPPATPPTSTAPTSSPAPTTTPTSSPAPTTTPTSVPATHTGEPWAGDTLWFAGFATLAAGGALLVVTAERRRGTAQR